MIRKTFSKSLVDAAMTDDRLILLTGDHGYALFDEFREHCSAQYINAGVAEQNMVGVAAGLAKAGYRPIVYGLSAFVPIRVLEQIKLDVCYSELPVIFIGDGAGVVYSTLGSSHQSTEDIAALRALPGLTIFSPSDAWEMEECFRLALAHEGPVYIRMGKSDLGDVHIGESKPAVQRGRLYPVAVGSGEVALIATGPMAKVALDLADHFGPNVLAVWSAPTIKPLEPLDLVEIAGNYKVIVTLEEHNVHGGFGSAVAEIVSEHSPLRVIRLGVPDRFSKLAGSYSYLMKEHGLDNEALTERIEKIIESLTGC